MVITNSVVHKIVVQQFKLFIKVQHEKYRLFKMKFNETDGQLRLGQWLFIKLFLNSINALAFMPLLEEQLSPKSLMSHLMRPK